MIYIRYSIYLIVFLSFFACQNQKSKKLDFNNIEEIQSLHKQVKDNYTDTSYLHLQKAKGVIESLEIVPDSIKAQNDYLIGMYFYNLGNLDSAAHYLHNATDYVKDTITVEREVNYFRQVGIVYFRLEKIGDCIANNERFKSLLRNNDFKKQALAYYFNENVYKQTAQANQALENNLLRIKMLKLAKDTQALVPALISQAYIKFFLFRDKVSTFKILEDLITKENTLSQNNKRLLFGEYGVYLFYIGEFEKAKEAYIKGRNFTPDIIGKRDLLATAYSNLAEVCMELKDYASATTYLDSIRILGFENISERYRRSAMEYKLRLIYETNGDIKAVLSYMDTVQEHQNRQYLAKYKRELVALGKASEKEEILQKEKQLIEIENLKQRNRLWLVSLSSLLILLTGILFYRQRKFKFEKESLQMQQRLLRTQMNPHFTFNTLYFIQSHIKKDPETAKDYLLKFSRLLRLILENSTYNYVQLEKELDALKNYLDLQLLKMPSKFEYNIVFENFEEDAFIFIPPMLLQPLIENSIEHGFAGIDYKGKVLLSFFKKDKHLTCTIEDNGIGLKKSDHSAKQSASMRLISDFLKKTTKEGIKIINKKNNSIEDTGVRIELLIPYKLTEND